jgi:hypothetical protein
MSRSIQESRAAADRARTPKQKTRPTIESEALARTPSPHANNSSFFLATPSGPSPNKPFLKPQGFSNLEASPYRLASSNTKSASNLRPGVLTPNNGKITSKEFNQKVYSRFESFAKQREEKIEEEWKRRRGSRKKITQEKFEKKILARFDNYSKESAEWRSILEKHWMKEITGRDPDSTLTVSASDFKEETLSRFEKYSNRASENKKKLVQEIVESKKQVNTPEGNLKQTPKKPSLSINGSPWKKPIDQPPKTPKIRVSPLKREIAEKFHEFEMKKRRKIGIEGLKNAELLAWREMVECTFSPCVNRQKEKEENEESE